MAKKLINKEEAFIYEINVNEGDTMDLNDFKEPGLYHSIDNAKNAPKSSHPGIFLVYSEKDKNIIIQFFISYLYDTKLKLYTRFYALTLNNWSNWITI